MATLRDPLFRTPSVTQGELDALRVSGMSSLARGYEAGRIGNDANAALAQEATLRMQAEQGDVNAATQADQLQARVQGLRQQQSAYAPAVGRVEDIHGLGDFGSWAAGQVGQGVASMQDPLLAGAALQGAGRLASAGPGALKGAGALLRGAGYVVPYAMNQRQMTGEAYGSMTDDPALMARTSAQERFQNANVYGAGAGLLDTVVPGMVAGKLTGAGLRAGVHAGGSTGGRILKELAVEGGTEALQEAGKQQTLGYMNPDRDTSGDLMDNVNAFAGGMAGAGPFVGAGELADSAYRRTGAVGGAVADKTREVIDMAAPYVEQAKDKAAPYVEKARDKAGQVIDMMAGEDGRVTPTSIKEKISGKAKDILDNYEAKTAERDLISGNAPAEIAPDTPEFEAWHKQTGGQRAEAITRGLEALVEAGDQQAQALYDQLGSDDDNTYLQALEGGADHILQQDEWQKFNAEVERRAAHASRWSVKAGELAGKGIRAAAGAAKQFGTAVIDGVKAGAKKNMQVDPFEQVLADQALKEGEDYVQGIKEAPGREKSRRRAEMFSNYLTEMLTTNTATAMRMPGGSPEAMTNFAKDMAMEIADLAGNWKPRVETGMNPLNDGPASLVRNGADSRGQQFDGLKLSLNSIARSMKLMYGKDAVTTVNEMQSIDGNTAPELFDMLRAELDIQNSRQAVRHNAEVEQEAQDAVIGSLGQDVEAALAREGVSVRTPHGKRTLFSLVKAIDDGVVSPKEAKALEAVVGKEALLNMRRTLRPRQASREDLMEDADAATLDEGVGMDDDGEISVNQSSNFDKALAETKADKMGAKHMVRFRNSTARNEGKGDIFARAGGVSNQKMRELEDAYYSALGEGKSPALPRALQRPALAMRGDKLHAGGDAAEGARKQLESEIGLDHSPEAMRNALRRDAATARKAGDREAYDATVAQGKALGARIEAGDPALADEARQFFEDRSEDGGWRTRTISVKEHLDEENADPMRRIFLYRDYLRQDAASSKLDENERKELLRVVRMLGRVIADGMDTKEGGKVSRTSPEERRNALAWANNYFGERLMAVADQLVDAAPEKITAGEIKDMAKWGAKALASVTHNSETDWKAYSEKNIIEFTAKDGTAMRIPAESLMRWGRDKTSMFEGTPAQGAKAQKNERSANSDKNDQYLKALMLGISAVLDSGLLKEVKGTDGKMAVARPYKFNQFGKKEFFSQSNGQGNRLNGLPPSLQLATTSVFGQKATDEGRLSRRKEPSESEVRRQAVKDLRQKVEKDWADETFVAEDTVPDGDGTAEVRQEVASRTRALGRTAVGRTREAQELGPEASSAADVNKHVEARARVITDALVDAPEQALALIERRLRQAKLSTSAQGQNGVAGGAHYAVPVIVALSDENLARFDADGELATLKAEAVKLLAASGMGSLKKQYAPAAPEVGAGLGKPSGVGKAAGTVANPVIGDLWAQDGVKVVSTNLGGVHGRGLAMQAKNKGLIGRGNVDFDSSPAGGEVITLAVKGRAPETAKVRGKPFSEQVVGGNLDLLKSEVRKLIKHARANPDTNFYLPFVGLGFGEGNPTDIMPVLEFASKEPNIFMVSKDQGTVDKYASSFVPGVRADATSRAKVKLTGTSVYLAKEVGASLGKPSGAGKAAGVQVRESTASGYATRTKHNADATGATVAIAADFMTAGEKLTKRVAGDKLLPIDIEGDLEGAGAELAAHMKALGTTTLNVAGNGIYTLAKSGWTQARVNAAVHQIIAEAHAIQPITFIVSGGQTGVDIAGAVAAKALGIPAEITLPAGYLQRGADKVDRQHTRAEIGKQIVDGAATLGLQAKFGSAAPEVGAGLGKPSGVGERAGAKYNAQSAGDQDATDRLISRRADARADKFRAFDADGVRQAEGGAFGPIASTRRFFATADGGTHTYAVPTQLLTLLDQTEAKFPEKSLSDILSVFAVQHTFYDRATKEFQSFGPDPRAPAGKLLEKLGALGLTGENFDHGVPVTSVRGVTRNQTIDFMADALAYARQIEGTPKVYVKWERVTGANIGKKFEGWLNAQQGGTKRSTQAERDAATAEIKRTLGDKITTRFEETTGYSGEYLDQEAAIVISMTPAAGTLQTAYHEAVHALIAKLVKGNAKATQVLNTLANHQPTLNRVHALLAGYPDAQAQLADGEERIAYIYQFWRAGMLDLPGVAGSGTLQKLRRMFKAIFGQISDLGRASALLGAFAGGQLAGDPSVAGKVIAKHMLEGTWGPKTLRKMDGVVQKIAAWTATSQSLLLMSDSPTAQKLGNTFWTNPGDEEAGGEKEGYLNARERMARRYTNRFSEIVGGLTARDHKDVIGYLQSEVAADDIAYAPHREAVEKIRALLGRFRTYMVDEKGMKIGDQGPLYSPRVWSAAALRGKKAEFMAMMEANHTGYNAEAVYNALVKNFEQNTEDSQHGRDMDEDAILRPAHEAGNTRILSFITGEQAAPFLEKSLVGTMTRYFHEGARAAEYTSRFGQDGKKLEMALSRTYAELRVAGAKKRADGVLADQDAETKWVARQMRDVDNAVSAMEGTLGRDIGDTWRATNSWVTVYQNVRLLPLALFSSVVDPLGMMARGATMREAYEGFLRGMGEVIRNWGEMFTGETKERKADKWEQLAMDVGAVDAAVFNHHVSEEYASVYMSPGAKRINDFMFKANGMEAWNKGMRVAATKSAVSFILRHKGKPDTHSVRWLEEIGLKPSDIYVDADGGLVTSKHALAAQEGITKDEAAKRVEKIHYAINRWVQGAVLTPNAAQRPAWGSDPHYSMFFHLKQFSYSFHQTLIKRAVNELEHGNLAPLGAFIWYIPVMIASDITKGLLQGGGELPAHMKGMDLGDWMAHGAQRAGLLGVGQIGVDAGGDIASLGGPAVEQIIDAYSDPLERTMMKAAPAHSIYAEFLK